jgi:hypothetical protein
VRADATLRKVVNTATTASMWNRERLIQLNWARRRDTVERIRESSEIPSRNPGVIEIMEG